MRMKFSAQLALCVAAGLTGSVFAQCPGAPAIDEDLGVLAPGTINRTVTITSNDVHWFKFTLASPIEMGALTYLDFDTAGTVGTSTDTELGVYDCAGNLMATDDDDSTGVMSALSFGSGRAVQQGDTTSVWSNGRDGRLPAGDYYVAVARFNATFGLTGFSVTSTATTGTTAALNIRLGTATALPDPAGTINLGTLSLGGTIQRTADSLSASQVQWYKVTVPAANLSLFQFLDMDTEGSVLAPTNATRIAVYNVTGAITGTLAPATRINFTTGLNDATDGSNSLSQISLGIGTRPAVGNGLAYNGRDGDLQAGTYLIGVAGPGTAPSGTSPTTGGNFGFTSTSTNAGTIDFRIAAGIQGTALSVAGGTTSAPELTSALLTATVSPGNPPPSTGVVVTANLSSVGGSSSQMMFDDGTNGDLVANNNVYSFAYTLPNTVQTGSYSIPVSVVDAQSRSASGTITLNVTNGPSGACCIASVCSTTRETLCFAGGGTYQGNGSLCAGVPEYTFSTSSGTFVNISGTGTLLTTVSACDDCTQNVAFPGAFTFNHLGNTYSSVNVSSNGNIQFGASNSNALANVNIPNTALPNNMLAPAWDDYNPSVAGDVYFLDDTANGRVIISWQNVPQFGIAVPDSNNFQVILYSSGNAEFRYGALNSIVNPSVAGDPVTIGYENIDGTQGKQYASALVGAGNTAVLLTAGVTTTDPCITGPVCDSIDFNNDGLFPDTQDLDDFLSVFGGGPCL